MLAGALCTTMGGNDFGTNVWNRWLLGSGSVGNCITVSSTSKLCLPNQRQEVLSDRATSPSIEDSLVKVILDWCVLQCEVMYDQNPIQYGAVTEVPVENCLLGRLRARRPEIASMTKGTSNRQ